MRGQSFQSSPSKFVDGKFLSQSRYYSMEKEGAVRSNCRLRSRSLSCKMSADPELARCTKMAFCSKEMIYSELIKRHSRAYCRKAETLVPKLESYRHQNPVNWRGMKSMAVASAYGLSLAFTPNLVFLSIVLWACATLICTSFSRSAPPSQDERTRRSIRHQNRFPKLCPRQRLHQSSKAI